MPDKRKRLTACAKAHNDTIWEACEAVWALIMEQEAEERQAWFSVFLGEVYPEDICTKSVDDFFPLDVFSRINKEIGNLGLRVLDNLIRQKPSEADFYKSLWDKLCDGTLLPDREAQVAFLSWLWVDTRTPYYQIEGGCKMESGEFNRLRDEIWPFIKRALFILSAPLEQKTERASLLMKLADEIKDERARTVYWAYIIGGLRDSVQKSKEPQPQ